MDLGSGCSACVVYETHFTKLKKCFEEEKKAKVTLQAKVDRLNSLNLQYRECLYSSQYVNFRNLKEEALNVYEQCMGVMEVIGKNSADHFQLKQKFQEQEVSILNLNKLLDEKCKELVNVKFLARQLECENSACKSKLTRLEKELSQMKRKLSAKQQHAPVISKNTNSRANRLIKQLLKLGKLGDEDIKLLKSMVEGKAVNSIEDDKDGSKKSNCIAAAKTEKQIFHCVLSPDEGLGLSPSGPPINQHPNSVDHDSNIATYNDSEGREQQQDDNYLDVQFGEERVEESTVVTEPSSGDDSVDYIYIVTNSNNMSVVRESNHSTVLKNMIYAGMINKEEGGSNIGNTENCEVINEDRRKSTVREHSERIMPSDVTYAGKTDKEQQPVEADENNMEEGDGGGNKNEMNQVEDNNCGSNIVNEIDIVYGQENYNEQSVDEDDLYGACSPVNNTVSSSCEMIVDSNSEECIEVVGSGRVNIDCDELKENKKAKNQQVAKTTWCQKKKERKHQLKTIKKYETLQKEVCRRKPDTPHLCNNNNNNNNNNEAVRLMTNSIDVKWLADQLSERLIDALNENKKNKDGVRSKQLIEKQTSKKFCKTKEMVKPKDNLSLTGIPVESSQGVDDMCNISPVLMNTHSADNPVIIRQKCKQVSKSNKRKLYLSEGVKCLIKKRKLLSGRRKSSWSITEDPILEPSNTQDKNNDILKSVSEEDNKQRKPSGQSQLSALSVQPHPSGLPELAVQSQSSVQHEITGQAQPSVSLHPFASYESQSQTFSPCKRVRDKSQSSVTREVTGQKQPSVVVSWTPNKLPKPCEVLSQSQLALPSEQLLIQTQPHSIPCEVTGKAQSPVHVQASASCEPLSQGSQLFSPCKGTRDKSQSSVTSEVMGQKQPCAVASQTPNKLPVPCDVFSQPQLALPSEQLLIKTQPHSLPCEVTGEAQSSVHVEASASCEPLSQGLQLFSPCKGTRDKSQSSVTSEVMGQKQPCAVASQTPNKLPVPCDVFSQPQLALLSEQLLIKTQPHSLPCEVTGEAQSSVHVEASASCEPLSQGSQLFSPCKGTRDKSQSSVTSEVMGKKQPCAVASQTPNKLPVPCEVLSQSQLALPSEQLLIKTQPHSLPCEVTGEAQSSVHVEASASCEPLSQGLQLFSPCKGTRDKSQSSVTSEVMGQKQPCAVASQTPNKLPVPCDVFSQPQLALLSEQLLIKTQPHSLPCEVTGEAQSSVHVEASASCEPLSQGSQLFSPCKGTRDKSQSSVTSEVMGQKQPCAVASQTPNKLPVPCEVLSQSQLALPSEQLLIKTQPHSLPCEVTGEAQSSVHVEASASCEPLSQGLQLFSPCKGTRDKSQSSVTSEVMGQKQPCAVASQTPNKLPVPCDVFSQPQLALPSEQLLIKTQPFSLPCEVTGEAQSSVHVEASASCEPLSQGSQLFSPCKGMVDESQSSVTSDVMGQKHLSVFALQSPNKSPVPCAVLSQPELALSSEQLLIKTQPHSLPCEVTDEAKSSVHVQASASGEPLNNGSQLFSPCKGMEDKSHSSTINEEMGQKQSCDLLRTPDQSPVSCEILSQPQLVPLSEQLSAQLQQPSTLHKASCQLHFSASSKLPVAESLKPLSQTQSLGAFHAPCEPLHQQLSLAVLTEEPMTQWELSPTCQPPPSQLDYCVIIGTGETKNDDLSLALEEQAEEVVIDTEKFKTFDDLEIPVNSQITSSLDDILKEDLHDFVLNENLLQPLLEDEYMGEEDLKSFQKTVSSVSNSKQAEICNNVNENCCMSHDFYLVSSDESEQLALSRKQQHTKVCESNQVEQFDPTEHLQTINQHTVSTNSDNMSGTLFDCVNYVNTPQDYVASSNVDNLTDDEKNVSSGSKIFETDVVTYEENIDLGLTVEITTEEDNNDDLTRIEIGNGIAAEPEMQDLQCNTDATSKTKRIADAVTASSHIKKASNRKNRKVDNSVRKRIRTTRSLALSSLIEKGIRTRSVPKLISQGKFSAVSETGHIKSCNVANNMHNHGSQRKTGINSSSVCNDALKLINRDICRIVTKAKNRKQIDQKKVDAYILKIDTKVKEMAEMPLDIDCPIDSVSEFESKPITDEIDLDDNYRKTGVISPAVKNVTQKSVLQPDIGDTEENQVQPFSMPLLDNYGIHDRVIQEVNTAGTSHTEEHGTDTHVKNVETHHQSLSSPVLDDITDSVGIISSELTVNAVDAALNEDYTGDMTDSDSQLLLNSTLSHGCTEDEVTVKDVRCDKLSTANVWPDQTTVYKNSEKRNKLSSMLTQEAKMPLQSEKCDSTVQKKVCVNDSKICTHKNNKKQSSTQVVDMKSGGQNVQFFMFRKTSELCKNVKSNSTSLTTQDVLQNQNTLSDVVTMVSGTAENEIEDDIFKTVRSKISSHITSNSDNNLQKKLSHSRSTRTGHNVTSMFPCLNKHSPQCSRDDQCMCVENKLPHVDELTDEGEVNDCDQFIHEPNVYDIKNVTKSFPAVTTDQIVCEDLAISDSSDSESVPEEETVDNRSNSTVIKKVLGDVTEDLYKDIKKKRMQLCKENLKETCNQIVKNHASDLVNESDLEDSEKIVCIDLVDSDTDAEPTKNVSKVDRVDSAIITEAIAFSNLKQNVDLCPSKGGMNKTFSPVGIKSNCSLKTSSNIKLKETISNKSPLKTSSKVKLKKTSCNKIDTNLMTLYKLGRPVDGKCNINQSRTLSTLCTTSNNVKNQTVCLESLEKHRAIAEDNISLKPSDAELNNIFNELKCPAPVTPFSSYTEEKTTNWTVALDRKEVFKMPEFDKQHVNVRTPKIYQSKNDSESDQLMKGSFTSQGNGNGSQTSFKEVLLKLSGACTYRTFLPVRTYRSYEICKQKRVDSNMTIEAVENDEKNIINNELSTKLQIIQEDQADKTTEIVSATKSVGTSTSNLIIQNKHTLPQIVERSSSVMLKRMKTYDKKVECGVSTEVMRRSINTPRMSIVKQINVHTEKCKDNRLYSCTNEKDAVKMDVNNQSSCLQDYRHTAPVTETKQQCLSYDTTVDGNTSGGVLKDSTEKLFVASSSTCPELNNCFSFYSSNSVVESEKSMLSDDNFNGLFIDDDSPEKSKEKEAENDDDIFEELSKYVVPCDSNVLAKACEFHRSDICKPKETVKREGQKKQTDKISAKENAVLVQTELMKLINCSQDERSELITVLYSIQGYGKEAIAKGIMLVLYDDPVVELTAFNIHKQSLKKLQLPPPPVSRTKQLLLCLVNLLLNRAVLENDFCLCVGSKITKKLLKSGLSIKHAASLVQFYTLICRMTGNVTSMKTFIYNILCNLKNRSHVLISEVLLMWPKILIPAHEVPLMRNKLIHMVTIHSIMNFSLSRDVKITRVGMLKHYLKCQYGYNMGEQTSEQMLQFLIDRLAEKDCKYAITMLFKRSKENWNQMKLIPALWKALEKAWYINEDAACSAIWLLGVACRHLSSSALNELNNTFELLKSYLFKIKGSPRLEEEIVIAIAHMHRLNRKSCIEILTCWKPKHGSVSVRVLQYLKPLICQLRPCLWREYFAKIEEIDQQLKEDQEVSLNNYIEKYGNTVETILDAT